MGLAGVRVLSTHDGELENTAAVREAVVRRVARGARRDHGVAAIPPRSSSRTATTTTRTTGWPAGWRSTRRFPGSGNPHFFSEHLGEGLAVQECHRRVARLVERARTASMDMTGHFADEDRRARARTRVSSPRASASSTEFLTQGRDRGGREDRRRVRRGVPRPRPELRLLLGADREHHVARVVQRVGEALRERRSRALEERRPALVAEHLADEPAGRPDRRARRGTRRARSATRIRAGSVRTWRSPASSRVSSIAARRVNRSWFGIALASVGSSRSFGHHRRDQLPPRVGVRVASVGPGRERDHAAGPRHAQRSRTTPSAPWRNAPARTSPITRVERAVRERQVDRLGGQERGCSGCARARHLEHAGRRDRRRRASSAQLPRRSAAATPVPVPTSSTRGAGRDAGQRREVAGRLGEARGVHPLVGRRGRS